MAAELLAFREHLVIRFHRANIFSHRFFRCKRFTKYLGSIVTRQLLIIEDDRDIREPLRDLLTSEGFEVHTAENGKVGLGHLSNGLPTPDLILLDLMMPVMDGYEFLRHKSASPSGDSVPVIVMTAAHPGPEALKRFPAIRQVLRKPLSIPVLLAAIMKHI